MIDMSHDATPVPVLTGQHVGSYEIGSLLGTGGMGSVYRARDRRRHCDVAIKVLRPDVSQRRGSQARLVREGRVAASLSHPGICTIHDAAEADGIAFVVMELIEGQPLSALVEGQPLPLSHVVRYGIQLADAVAHIHDRGLLHGDLKSSNVMITTDGRVKVVDFGLSGPQCVAAPAEATTQEATSMTGSGSVAGSLPYMAPEQFRGEPVDRRTDVWALGVVLHEMAAGDRPFHGRTSFELSAAVLHERLVIPLHVPSPLRPLIRRCLEKQPGRRYQQACDVRAALERLETRSGKSAAA